MLHYNDAFYHDTLYHHGVKGMHWGIRRYQNKSGQRKRAAKALSNSKSVNLDKWGKTDSTNVLYIAGYSGSGKSTIAQTLAKKGDPVIHLDSYTESGLDSFQDQQFNAYLDKYVPNWREIPGGINNQTPAYWKTVDALADAIDSFGKNEYHKGHRVIVEGIQIADGWLRENKDYYSTKPSLILGTSGVKSMIRGSRRDNKSLVETIAKTKSFIFMRRNLNNLAVASGAVKGEEWIRQYISDTKKSR